MTSAGAWALSRAGTADLLRYYHVRARELTVHELVCVWSCLPEESATRREASEMAVTMDQQLTAILIDQVRALAAGLGGKKLQKKDQLSSKLTKREMEKALEEQQARERIIEMAKEDKAKYNNDIA